jgi:ribulose 1,5-bisphosphate carboxylase large subunit-like protein
VQNIPIEVYAKSHPELAQSLKQFSDGAGA